MSSEDFGFLMNLPPEILQEIMNNLDIKDKVSLCQSTSLAGEWCMKMRKYLVGWDDLYTAVVETEDVDIVKYLVYNLDILSTLEPQNISYLLYEAFEADNFEMIKMFLESDELDIEDYLSTYRLALDSDTFDDYAVEIFDLIFKKIPDREDIGKWDDMKDIIEQLGYLDSRDDIETIFNMIKDKYSLKFKVNIITGIFLGEKYIFWGKNNSVISNLIYDFYK